MNLIQTGVDVSFDRKSVTNLLLVTAALTIFSAVVGHFVGKLLKA